VNAMAGDQSILVVDLLVPRVSKNCFWETVQAFDLDNQSACSKSRFCAYRGNHSFGGCAFREMHLIDDPEAWVVVALAPGQHLAVAVPVHQMEPSSWLVNDNLWHKIEAGGFLTIAKTAVTERPKIGGRDRVF
jgi:hypothetical protein